MSPLGFTLDASALNDIRHSLGHVKNCKHSVLYLLYVVKCSLIQKSWNQLTEWIFESYEAIQTLEDVPRAQYS